MGIRNSRGGRPFSGGGRAGISLIFEEAQEAFAQIAARDGLEIFKSYVPIDTELLKDSIKASVNNRVTTIEVPNTVLRYSSKKSIRAKKLALILEIGLGKAGSILHRTQSNTGDGTSAGSPTEDWFRKAVIATRQHMQPIGKRLIQEAMQKAVRALLNG